MVCPSIIKALILEDLRHNQLLYGLEKLGINMDQHHLQLLDIVGALLEVDLSSNEIYDAYMATIESAADLPIVSLGKNLESLAADFYELLLVCIEKETPTTKDPS